MDIEYDPSEEVADDVDGILDYSEWRGIWSLHCSEHGQIEQGADGSAQAHDALIQRWVQHMQQEHHGDGIMSAEDRSMLINQAGEVD